MGARRMHLLLELDLDSEPVSGEVGLVGAEQHSFTGYANLIATLQSIRTDLPDGHSLARGGSHGSDGKGSPP
jgi:hypothetical protein